MINQAAYDQYWEKGWLVAEGVFQPEEVEQVAELATKIGIQELSSAAPITIDHSEDGRQAPRKIVQPFLKEPLFRQFVLDPRISDILKLLLGKQPLLLTDQIFMKPPHFGSAKPFHQDNAYFQCFPAAEVITSWIALDDVDEGNGCLRYIDGSHKGPLLPHSPLPNDPNNRVPPEELIDRSKESLALVRKGGVVFHHSQTLHTSHRNESDRWRRGYGGHWITADVRCEKTGESMPGMAFNSLDAAYFHNDLYPESLQIHNS
jgi:ectoine hydroxylase-related dioxygenase (phytanoyl-CoA dioxygenase family)